MNRQAILCCMVVLVLVCACRKKDELVVQYDYGKRMTDGSSRDTGNKQRELYISQAKIIRSKFEKWAKNHAELVKLPEEDDEKRRKAFLELYKALPSNSVDAGVSGKDINPNNSRPLQGEDSIIFTWNAFKTSDIDPYSSFFFKEYMKNGDFPLCKSINIGGFHIVFWTSGKITEKLEPGDNAGSEIVPSYDFARR